MPLPSIGISMNFTCNSGFVKCCPRKLKSKCCEADSSSDSTPKEKSYESDSTKHKVKKVASKSFESDST